MNASQRRVLYVLQGLPVPFDRRAWLHATTLARNGYAVSFICPKGRGFNTSREELDRVDIYRYWRLIEGEGKLAFIVESLWCFCATLLLSLRVQLFGRGFDILHICNPPEIYWPMAWFWRAFGKVFIWDHRDLSPELAEAKFGRADGLIITILRLLEKFSFAAAQIVIATNESYKKIAIERGKKRPEDIFIVRSAPSVTKFKLYDPDPSFKNGKPNLILYLGEMGPQDGVDNLIRALRVLHDDFGRRDFHCVLIGGGTYQPTVAAYAREIGVDHLCTFTGIVSDEMLCRILSSADVAIDPLPKNGWSNRSTMNKVLEYMFFGLPIVVGDLTEAKVSAADAALYVEPGSAPAMASGIVALLDNPERRARMGASGQKRLHDALAFEYSVPNLLAAYDAAWANVRRAQLPGGALMPTRTP
ncbi:MAG TPA: glycosyltransferase family 4 protein [Stellaceae bacterium]|nr:glycosyltransferase family 4 protein [Stellaceae bacterium]